MSDSGIGDNIICVQFSFLISFLLFLSAVPFLTVFRFNILLVLVRFFGGGLGVSPCRDFLFPFNRGFILTVCVYLLSAE